MNFSTIKNLLFICLLTTVTSASDFPKSFGKTGDGIYENIQKYKNIKSLDIYQGRPELIEAFCIDANMTMQKGFNIDAMKEDLEAEVTKEMIKDYVKDLRRLSAQNEEINEELQKDIQVLVQAKNFEALKTFQKSGILLSAQTQQVLKAQAEKAKQEELAKDKKFIQTLAEQTHDKSSKQVAIAQEENDLLFYKTSLIDLKDELYALRESGEEAKTACLNDITAINYWMIRILENERDDCALRDAIKQMKSYDKAILNSCGNGSMRYIEWHGRIKPYVGTKLFQAEANCR